MHCHINLSSKKRSLDFCREYSFSPAAQVAGRWARRLVPFGCDDLRLNVQVRPRHSNSFFEILHLPYAFISATEFGS